MKLAFYKYQHGNWKDWIIAKLTRSKYSHVELIFDDGSSFSSSPRDGGVRRKNIKYNYDKWEIVRVDISKNKYYAMLKKANEIQLCEYKYDWVAIFFHCLGIRSYKKFICSDLIHYLLTGRLEFKTPQDLYERYTAE